MRRKRLARLALLAYPRALRASKGEEIVGTLLDASGSSNAAYARELVALIGGGLRVRAGTPGRPGAMRQIADGFCYAGVGMLALNIAVLVGERLELHGAGPGANLMWRLLLLSGCLSAALVGYDRIAGAGALVAIATSAAHFTGMQAAAWSVPAACFAGMLMMPRRQPRRIYRAAWLIPTGALGIAAGGRGPSTYLLLAPLVVIVPLALVRLARDPRLAIACSLLAATIAVAETADAVQGGSIPIGLPLTILLFAATPLTIAFAARRPDPQRPDS